MNKLVYILLFTFLVSCKSTSSAQENEKKSSNVENIVKVQKPRFGDSNNGEIRPNVALQDQIPPNTIHFSGNILNISENEKVCGRMYETAIQVKVKQIKGTGSGLVNMIFPKQKIVLRLPNNVSNSGFLKEVDLNKELMFVIIEGLCKDFSQVGYEIITISDTN